MMEYWNDGIMGWRPSGRYTPAAVVNWKILHGCVKVAQNVTFSGRHGDLPLRELVGATLCGRPDL